MATFHGELDPPQLRQARDELLSAREDWVVEIRSARAVGVAVDEAEEMLKLVGWIQMHSPPLNHRTLHSCLGGVREVKLLVAAARAALAVRVIAVQSRRS